MSSSVSLTAQLLTISILSLQRQLLYHKIASRSNWNSNYDFIVVGGGGAGAIVASRLSENLASTVLLLEAGGSETSITDIPSNYYELVGNPNLDWNYPLVNQPNLGQAYTMPAHLSVGKILGGSTTMSGMVYNRGNRRHFDEWENVYGCRGWNYNNILPYFLRSENQVDPRYQNIFHNISGPITVSSNWDQLTSELPTFSDYISTAQIAGYAIIDVNGPSQNGVTLFQHTIQNGRKVTSSNAYLNPNANRTNLHIVTRSMVTRILFNGNRAVGVAFNRGGQNFTVMANREVILSAGTVGSAQLLMLSGVGPQNHLTNLSIPVLQNLPVGNNLHDHTNVILYFDVPHQLRSYETVELNVQNLYNFYVNHQGPLTMFPNVATYITTDQNDDPEWPDIMTEMVRSNNRWKNLSDHASQYQNFEAWKAYWAPYTDHRLISFDVQMVRPRARGTLRLASSNPFDYPLIDPNYFGNAQDLNAMVYGIRQVLTQITNIGPFAQTARFIDDAVPGCTKCAGNDTFCNSYIRCFIRQTSVAVLRHVGTCRCGSSNDPNAVVDERLRVINLQGIRVIDGSIMPQVINANSWMATAMIAEYGSQMIRDDNSMF